MKPVRPFVLLLLLAPLAQAKDPIQQRVDSLVARLDSESEGRRHSAAAELRKMGSAAKAAAPALAKLLDEPSDWVADEMMKALEAMAPDAVEPVAKALKSKNVQARIRASLILEKWGQKASGQLKLLLPALKDKNRHVRTRVAKTIGTFGEPAAAGCYRLLTARSAEHREAAALALAGIGPVTFTKLRTTLKGKNAYGRAGAATALGYAGAPAEEAIDDLVAATRDGKEYVREQAVLALGRIGRRPEASIDALLRAMGDEERTVSRAAIDGAVLFGLEGVPQLISILDLVADRARPGAIEALSRIGGAADVPLTEGLESKSPGIRAGCAEALGGMNLLTPVDAGAIGMLLEDAVPEVRIAAARALIPRGGLASGETSALCRTLKDDVPAVRAAAAEAIGAVASGGQAITALEEAMKDGDGLVRITAHHARARLYGGKDELLASVRKTLKNASAPTPERIAAALVCRDLAHGASPAVPDLVALIEDKDPGLRRAAVDALGSIASAHGTGLIERRKRYERAPKPTRDAMEAALGWLAKYQDVSGSGVNDEDGRWDSALFVKHQPEGFMQGIGGPLYSAGVTGMALSAFLSVGYVDRGEGQPYAANVKQGLEWLLSIQQEDGCLTKSKSSQHFMLCHGFATTAMCEAWLLTGDPRYGRCAQRALDFSCVARNPDLAWRYGPRDRENDTDVTTVILQGLRLGVAGGLRVDPAAFEGGGLWIEAMTDPSSGQTGYIQPGGMCARPEGLQEKYPPEESQAMTAAGLWSRMLIGKEMVDQKTFGLGVDLCAQLRPSWNGGKVDMYYWFFGSLAFAQVKGKGPETWVQTLQNELFSNQCGEDPAGYRGSWDPAGPWGPDGGRIYSTAILATSLAAPYTYARGFWDSPKPTGAFAKALAAVKSASKDKDLDADTRALAARWLVRILGE